VSCRSGPRRPGSGPRAAAWGCERYCTVPSSLPVPWSRRWWPHVGAPVARPSPGVMPSASTPATPSIEPSAGVEAFTLWPWLGAGGPASAPLWGRPLSGREASSWVSTLGGAVLAFLACSAVYAPIAIAGLVV